MRLYKPDSLMFQLTTSRRGRLLNPKALQMSVACFNSRPHEEVDCVILLKIQLYYVSTHDLTKRSTRGRIQSHCCKGVSTHDLTKRSTDIKVQAHLLVSVSTHDLTKRSTAIFTQKVFLSKSLFVLIAYNIFILH